MQHMMIFAPFSFSDINQPTPFAGIAGGRCKMIEYALGEGEAGSLSNNLDGELQRELFCKGRKRGSP